MSDDALVSEETERAVLGSVLVDNEILTALCDRVTRKHFGIEAHGLIWEVMVQLHGEGVPIDVRTLQARLEVGNRLGRVGGLAYLAGLDLDLPDSSRAEHYADILADRHCRRLTLKFGKRCIEESRKFQGHGSELFARCAVALSTLDLRQNGSQSPDLARIMGELAPEHEGVQKVGLHVTWGLRSVDQHTLGLQPGAHVLLGARPGEGKSALAAQVAWLNARLGRRVAYRCLADMTRKGIANRILSQVTNIPLLSIRSGDLTGEQREHLRRARAELSEMPMIIEDTGQTSPEGVAAWARRLRAFGGLDLLIVDQINDMGEGTLIRETLSRATLALKRLAVDEGIPVLDLAQLSRNPSRRAGMQKRDSSSWQLYRPELEDLRDSSELEQRADIVAFLFRPGKYEESMDPAMTEFIIAKHRDGWTGTVHLKFQPDTTRFGEI